MANECSVVIPVYSAFPETEACLRSVLANSPEAKQIFLIDDASPDGQLEDYLSKHLRKDPRLQISRNGENLGFVGTCNKGMDQAGNSDVVLLNSDTEVTPGWLKKLSLAAYSRLDVATVTPFTNKGTICSLPYFGIDNELPSNYRLDEFALLVEEVSENQYPELPTCVGHCIYIRRDAINLIGQFDAENFGRGYGEENDFSCRARKAGLVDILDDATFIFHKGNMSFREDREELSKRNTEVINKIHPHYFDEVGRYCRENRLGPVRIRILDEMMMRANSSAEKRILHILQNGPFTVKDREFTLGGTELHVQGLINNIDEDVSHWSLVPAKRCYYLTAHFPGGEREFILDLGKTSLEAILRPEFFDLIHLHHSRFIDHQELCQALIKHGNYIVSFHDFILVCPRFHLYTPFRKLCNGHECTESCGYGESYIRDYRASTFKMLSLARKLVCFSNSTSQYVSDILIGDFNWKRIPHGIESFVEGQSNVQEERLQPGPDRPLKVIFPGFIPQHKGSLIIEEIIKTRKLQVNGLEIPVEWHVVGKLFLDAGDKVIQHGEYKAGEIYRILCDIDGDLVVVLSICPETYCLTLDEGWNAGLPAVVTPLGAPAERVRETGAGWVLEELSAEAFIELLEEIVSDWNGYLKRRDNIALTKVCSVGDEASSYADAYQEFLSEKSQGSFDSLLNYLRNFGLATPPPLPIWWKIAGKLTDKTIYLLDAFKIRGGIQRLAIALLPRRILETLKGAR